MFHVPSFSSSWRGWPRVSCAFLLLFLERLTNLHPCSPSLTQSCFLIPSSLDGLVWFNFLFVRYEDTETNGICIGPVNKSLDMLSEYFASEGKSKLFELHQTRVADYLWLAADGMKMQVRQNLTSAFHSRTGHDRGSSQEGMQFSSPSRAISSGAAFCFRALCAFLACLMTVLLIVVEY